MGSYFEFSSSSSEYLPCCSCFSYWLEVENSFAYFLAFTFSLVEGSTRRWLPLLPKQPQAPLSSETENHWGKNLHYGRYDKNTNFRCSSCYFTLIQIAQWWLDSQWIFNQFKTWSIIPGATLSHISTNTVFIHWTAAFSRDTTICGHPSSSSTRINETQPPSGNVIFASFVDLSRLIFQESFWYLVCTSVQNTW